MRRARWRRTGAALALAALLVQAVLVVLHLQAYAAQAPWDDPTVICHSGGSTDADGGAPSDSDEGKQACPLCQVLHQVAKALPPSDAFILLPSPRPLPPRAAPIDRAAGAPRALPSLPRGPPISG